MSIEVKVPQLPESVADATLVAWNKQPGDSVRRDENLVDLETDKVVLEVPAPADGVIAELRVADGATVVSGDVLAILTEGEAGDQATAVAEPAKTSAPEKTPVAPPSGDSSAAHKLSPSVRRLIEEHDLDPGLINGTGKDGRINKSDVMAYLDSVDHDGGAADVPSAIVRSDYARTEERVPMTRLRARIAERMVDAQATAAMLTTFNEVDLTRVIELRSRYKERFAEAHGVKLGYMSFFVRASAEALQRYPVVNASVEGNDILYHNYQDIGIAVSTDRGLLVPVLRDTGQMSFADIEQTIAELGKKGREGTIGLEELTGGTFTITNGGIFGSMMSTPILNPPQSAILGMHNIVHRPIAVDGEVAIRPMMYLALSYDHRIIDGRQAVQFLVNIKESLEDPGRLLLGL